MTLEELRKSNAIWLTAAEIAPILGANPNTIRFQAHENPQALGFPVSVCGKMVRIPRVPFLRFLGTEESLDKMSS